MVKDELLNGVRHYLTNANYRGLGRGFVAWPDRGCRSGDAGPGVPGWGANAANAACLGEPGRCYTSERMKADTSKMAFMLRQAQHEGLS